MFFRLTIVLIIMFSLLRNLFFIQYQIFLETIVLALFLPIILNQKRGIHSHYE